MVTTQEDILVWLKDAQAQGDVSHVIVAYDMFDFGDYPVLVRRNENVIESVQKLLDKQLTKVMEVYKLDGNIYAQLNEYRAWHTD